MNFAQRRKGGERSMSVDQIAAMIRDTRGAGMGRYQGAPNQTLEGKPVETIDPTFEGLVQRAYAENGIVFACVLARQLLFSEVRFKFRSIDTEELLPRTTALRTIERPWKGATTRKLLSRMEQDGSLAGNAFICRRKNGELRRLRPDWVTIVKGSKTDSEIDAEVIGYAYRHKGQGPIEIIFPEDMAHYAPIPDPLADHRGMSWLTPIIRTIEADEAAETHKQKYFENSATPNMVVSLDKDLDEEEFKGWVAVFEGDHVGVWNAFKTLYLGGGADVEVVGHNLKDVDFKAVTGAGESRIASAAGVPAIIAGLSEGMEYATYANFHQARRKFADGTISPLWGEAAATLEPLLAVPEGAELWYDTRGIAFLQEDEKDAADIFNVDAESSSTLWNAGYKPDSIKLAVASRDVRLLEHTGLDPVQAQPADGSDKDKPESAAAKRRRKAAEAAALKPAA